jgi:hypothetical protein
MKCLLACTLLLPATSGAAPAFETAGLRFFRQADGPILPAARRVYTTRFDATRLDRLGVELAATYAVTEDADPVPLDCALRRPDGSSAPAERPMEFRFFAGKTSSQSANLLWGRPDGSDWPVGTYEVECRAGEAPVAKASFEVLRNPPEVQEGEVRIEAIRIFAVEELLPPIKDRRYALAFAADQTRRIGVELEFAHAPIGHAVKVPVDCWFFWPDGQTSPPLVLSYEPEPTWAGGYSAAAMGFEEPGGWNAGVYTVSCAIGGQPVAVERFDVE